MGSHTGTARTVAETATLMTALVLDPVSTPGGAADLDRFVPLLLARTDADEGRARLEAGGSLAVLDAVAACWTRGWTPRDLLEVVGRRSGPAAVDAARDALAAEAARRPRGHAAGLAGLGVAPWPDPGPTLVAHWRGVGGDLGPALRTALGLLAVVVRLPGLPADPAERGPSPSPSVATGPDAKVLARVRALLAKAESTDYAEEAEALSAKAQELVGRHALAQALAEAGTARAPAGATSRRLWLDPPYVSAKSSLVHQVGRANRCRAVGIDGLDLVTVVGHPADVATVELLVTSLLVQADRAMLAAARSAGGSRTRSFRHAFLLSYATRIGERLAEAAAAAEAETAAAAEAETVAVGAGGGGSALLPVLAAREEEVERAVAALFPRMTTRRVSVGNAAGWSAGRAAADTASLRPGREGLPG